MLGRGVHLPALDVRRPRDQRVAVPEADGLAVPTRHVLTQARHVAVELELAADVHRRDEVARDARDDLHDRRRSDDVMLPHGRFVPAAHEAFGPAVLRRPLRFVRVAVVIGLLHEARLILRRQQRQNRRHLDVPHAVPVLVVRRAAGVHVPTRPLFQRFCARLLLRAAALRRLGEQRRVMLLRGLERDTGSRSTRADSRGRSSPTRPWRAACRRSCRGGCRPTRPRWPPSCCSGSSACRSRARGLCRNLST